jgi:hypothetical protein
MAKIKTTKRQTMIYKTIHRRQRSKTNHTTNWCDLRCSVKIRSSCSTCAIRRVARNIVAKRRIIYSACIIYIATRRGAQLVHIGIPTVCWKTCLPNITNMLSIKLTSILIQNKIWPFTSIFILLLLFYVQFNSALICTTYVKEHFDCFILLFDMLRVYFRCLLKLNNPNSKRMYYIHFVFKVFSLFISCSNCCLEWHIKCSNL